MPTTTSSPEPDLEWRWFNNLIRDVQEHEPSEQEPREQFAAIFHQWGLVLRQFRGVEQRTSNSTEVTPRDRM